MHYGDPRDWKRAHLYKTSKQEVTLGNILLLTVSFGKVWVQNIEEIEEKLKKLRKNPNPEP